MNDDIFQRWMAWVFVNAGKVTAAGAGTTGIGWLTEINWAAVVGALAAAIGAACQVHKRIDEHRESKLRREIMRRESRMPDE